MKPKMKTIEVRRSFYSNNHSYSARMACVETPDLLRRLLPAFDEAGYPIITIELGGHTFCFVRKEEFERHRDDYLAMQSGWVWAPPSYGLPTWPTETDIEKPYDGGPSDWFLSHFAYPAQCVAVLRGEQKTEPKPQSDTDRIITAIENMHDTLEQILEMMPRVKP